MEPRRKTSTTACRAYRHALAILAFPETSLDKIANEAVIETVLPTTRKLSVVLRCCRGNQQPITTAKLRSYVGEIYSQLWDCALQMDSKHLELPSPILPDVVVYPQNLPNTAPESWIDIQPDLDCVCSHDDIVGWSSIGNNCRSYDTQDGNGVGGLDDHVRNVNVERRQRKLSPVKALHVRNFETVQRAAAEVIFLEDEESPVEETDLGCPTDDDDSEDDFNEPGNTFLSGAPTTAHLYDGVCVGGTFDGLHFGHRKLLTLAASSVTPVTGRLLVGVTVDAMLQQKTLAEYIPPFHERCAGVRDFLDRLAPGMKNRVFVVPLTDKFGPPGQRITSVTNNSRGGGGLAAHQFDALVLSHETLETGYLLNQHRVTNLGLPPLQLLCTRRTEAHGMSSTALRRLRKNQQQLGQMRPEDAVAIPEQQQQQQ